MKDVRLRAWDKKRKVLSYNIEVEGDYLHGDINGEIRGLQLDYEIMLYTGLKDKNGKEIYFDDILKTPYGIGKVEFNVNWARICIGDYSLTAPLLAVSEVIGNIYVNPELLK